ncbi:hypothetical protein E5288_WYG001982 [Bos mutus]|uniref:Uncharacterized protein n=1 Tax=Bos mutus TaxID=72004 RepID=A0A6B0RJB0_9CETA|nr:hypothetical protein [Bos mutus]
MSEHQKRPGSQQLPALFHQEGGHGLAQAPAKRHWREVSIELLTQKTGTAHVLTYSVSEPALDPGSTVDGNCPPEGNSSSDDKQTLLVQALHGTASSQDYGKRDKGRKIQESQEGLCCPSVSPTIINATSRCSSQWAGSSGQAGPNEAEPQSGSLSSPTSGRTQGREREGEKQPGKSKKRGTWKKPQWFLSSK